MLRPCPAQPVYGPSPSFEMEANPGVSPGELEPDGERHSVHITATSLPSTAHGQGEELLSHPCPASLKDRGVSSRHLEPWETHGRRAQGKAQRRLTFGPPAFSPALHAPSGFLSLSLFFWKGFACKWARCQTRPSEWRNPAFSRPQNAANCCVCQTDCNKAANKEMQGTIKS